MRKFLHTVGNRYVLAVAPAGTTDLLDYRPASDLCMPKHAARAAWGPMLAERAMTGADAKDGLHYQILAVAEPLPCTNPDHFEERP